ncbi:MAG: glycoside hydrolase family 65 protein [Clostridia bacterium]|nr:glycoside hydrolase family 65 protein [Clostridia bacterium]
MKKYTVTYWGKYAPEAYVSNGVIGFRFGKNPFTGAIGLLAGFTTLREKMQVEAMAVLPTAQLTFEVDGTAIEPEILSQSYDFANGEFTTTARLGNVTLTYMLYCSRTCPTLLISHLTFTGTPAAIAVNLSYDVREEYRYTLGGAKYFEGFNDALDGKCLQHSYDGTTSAGIAYKIFGDVRKTPIDPVSGVLGERAELDLGENGAEIQLVTSYVPSAMHSEPHNQAQRMIQLSSWQGLERLREANRKAWAELWKSRITIDGAGEEWQDAIDASFFYLMSSVSEFSPTSVSPYGLSQPDAYEGHCFWDTESFMFMTPLFCAPHVARAMLDYRFRRIEAAENNARINGYRGIQFPWQSGTTGSEVTAPWCAQAGEQHVNLDIALAFDGYARVSGDEGYIREQVWPVMRGVAEWIESRVEKTKRGYEILHITGIDEEIDDVNNDSYSNLMAAKVLRSAAAYSRMLGLGERKKWLEIADRMFLPVREDGVMEQYEGMPEKPQQHPTSLMSYFPYGYTDENQYATLDYFIKHDMFDYCRYPMLSGFLGVYPAWNGDRETSLKFYEEANLTFFCEPFHSSTEWSIRDKADRVEMSRPVGTNFITARGSLLSGLIMGLTKMCPWKGAVDGSVDEWFGEDIVLPSGWTKLTIGRVCIRGKAYRITAEHGAKRAVLEELDEE